MNRRVHIADARRVAEATGARQVIVIAFYGPEAGPGLDGRVASSSYGTTRAHCAAVASVQDDIFERLILGDIPGPR